MLTQWFFGHRMHVGCMFYLADPHLQSKFCERGVELGSGLASLLFFGGGNIVTHTHTPRNIFVHMFRFQVTYCKCLQIRCGFAWIFPGAAAFRHSSCPCTWCLLVLKEGRKHSDSKGPGRDQIEMA